MKIFADQCKSVVEGLRDPINVVGTFVTRADGFYGAFKRALCGSA